MNNTFNLQRFLRFFKKYTLENAKTYFLLIFILLGILSLIIGFLAFAQQERFSVNTQLFIFMIFVLLGGSIFTSMIFMEIGDKKKAIPLLTLPVSHFEKYLVAWIYTYLIFSVVSLSSFYLVDYTFIALAKPRDYTGPGYVLNLLTDPERWYVPLIGYTLFHSFTFWGAIYFERLHFIKTAFIFFISLLVFSLLSRFLMSLITGGGVQQNMLFSSVSSGSGQHNWDIYAGMPLIHLGLYMLAAVVVLLWVSAFYSLKEKQV
jgi:hypothetical protein